MAEAPFKISIPNDQLEELKKKLALVRLPDELDNAQWDYGVPLADIKRLVEYWRDTYDWRKAETKLNIALPMFTRDIAIDNFGTLNIHYIHKRSDAENAIPLLFVHGWPGSFLEVLKILPLLAQSSLKHPSFHVVAVSLPGFGFSEAPTKPGFGIKQYGEVGHKLMLALGYDQYVTQGGDWGSIITQSIAFHYPKHAKAWHSNMPLALKPPALLTQPLLYLAYLVTPYTQAERIGLQRTNKFLTTGNGFMLEQGTQPQTIGYSLADSPVGLLAWIYEELVQCTDSYPWTPEEVITWISIYWFSRAGPAASVRIYYEFSRPTGVFARSADELGKRKVTVPTGFSRFPKEVLQFPHTWTRKLGKVVFDRRHSHGGHFAAYERPEALVGDLRDMFGKDGPAYGVVKGHDGYDE